MNYDKIDAILRTRRQKSLQEAKEKKDQLYGKHPELKDLDMSVLELSEKRNLAEINEDFSLSRSVGEQLEQVVKKRNALWKTLGVAKLLTPKFHCKKCEDRGYIDSKPCDCLKTLMALELRDEYSLGNRLEYQNFKTFRLDYFPNDEPVANDGSRSYTQREIMEINLIRAQQFADSFPNGESMLFVGDTGLGKTFLVNCIADALINKGNMVVYHTHVSLNHLITSNLSFTRSEEIVAKYNDLLDCDLLIIDDVNFDRLSIGDSHELFEIIDRRLSSRRSTIITTNTSFEKLREIDQRMFSRIHKFRRISFLGTDLRTLKD